MEIIRGDLLDSKCNHIAHCCNCFHTMGGGIASAIKERFPEAYEADLKTKCGDRKKMGSYSWGYSFIHDKTIYNLYGQYSYGAGKHLEEDSLYKALIHLKNNLTFTSNLPYIKLGLPWKIGCGLAGGNWKEVKLTIENIFEKSSFPVYWVKLPDKLPTYINF